MTNPGPARWERAIKNARLNPNSHGARLLRHRLNNVEGLPFNGVTLRVFDGGYAKSYYTCSDFCAGLYIQRATRGAFSTKDEVNDALAKPTITHPGTTWSGPYAIGHIASITTLTRTVTCFTCGRKVHTDGSVDTSNRVDFSLEPDTAQVLKDWELELLQGGVEETPAPVQETTHTVWFNPASGEIRHKKPNYTEVTFTAREYALFTMLTYEDQVEFLNNNN